MSDTKSECSSPKAFKGEMSSGSSIVVLDRTKSESTNVEILEDTKVPTQVGGTSDLQAPGRGPLTSGRKTEVAEVRLLL